MFRTFCLISFLLVSILTYSTCEIRGKSKSKIFVENYSGRNLDVYVNGSHWIDINESVSKIKKLKKGSYDVSIYDRSKNKYDEYTITVNGRSKYVMNLLEGANYFSSTTINTQKSDANDIINKFEAGDNYSEEYFFKADYDYVLAELPENLRIVRNSSYKPATFLIRNESNAYINLKANEYWRKKSSNQPKENIDKSKVSEVYDIIKEDSICEKIDIILDILAGKVQDLEIRCSDVENLPPLDSMEIWMVNRNRIVQYILSNIITEKIPLSQSRYLSKFVASNKFDDYFSYLDSMSIHNNKLVAFQARYNRIRRAQEIYGTDKSDILVMENRLRHSMGFETISLYPK